MAGSCPDEYSRQNAILAGVPYIVTKQFPWRLHEMLDQAHQDGDEFIVSWLPGGRAFKVHRPAMFVEKIMKNHFNQTKYKSFQRQLNLWGFERNTKESLERGSYYHPLFVRGRKDMCQEMGRQKIKADSCIAPKSKKAKMAVKQENEESSTGGTSVEHTLPQSVVSSPRVVISIPESGVFPSMSVTPSPRPTTEPTKAVATTSVPSQSAIAHILQKQSMGSNAVDAMRLSSVRHDPRAPLVASSMSSVLEAVAEQQRQALLTAARSPHVSFMDPFSQADVVVLQALQRRAAIESILANAQQPAGVSLSPSFPTARAAFLGSSFL